MSSSGSYIGVGASSSAAGLGTARKFGFKGGQVARDAGVPPTIRIDPVSARREVTMMASEEERYNVEKFIKNGAKLFIAGTDPFRA